MIRSMTGYGKGQYSDLEKNIIVEIKAVNHRYLDVIAKMSRRYSFAEEEIKKTIKNRITRGKVEVSVQLENLKEVETEIIVSEELAAEYLAGIEKLKGKTGIKGDISLEYIASLPDVIRTTAISADEEAIKENVVVATKRALDAFLEMSIKEGKNLGDDIRSRVNLFREYLDEVERKAGRLPEIYKEKLAKRIQTLLEGETEIAQERIYIEAAIIADKANVTEEIVRLRSHLLQLEEILYSEEKSKGKKMDFLVQELNRETNTIGSKANDLEITNIMIEMKSEIEKIREQIQNIQ